MFANLRVNKEDVFARVAGYVVIVKVLRCLRMTVSNQGLFKPIFDHNAGHLALFKYGHCGNYG